MTWRTFIFSLVLFAPQIALAVKGENASSSSSSGGVDVGASGLPVSIVALCILGISVYSTFFRRR